MRTVPLSTSAPYHHHQTIMDEGIDHRMTDIVACSAWSCSRGGQSAPTLTHMPQDVFVNICTLLSVRDILAVRMSNKCLARFTRDSAIWTFFLRKLTTLLPLLPATSKYRFGQISPTTYEWLMTRGLYLEQNWRRQNPIASHSRFEAFDRTTAIKMLPGGKYMVSISRNLMSGMYALVLWDLDHNGRRVALTGETEVSFAISKLEAKFGVIDNAPHVVIAYCTCPVHDNKGLLTKVSVLTIPISVLEEIVLNDPPSLLFRHRTETRVQPFKLHHKFVTNGEITQLALGDFDGEMVLVVVHRPRTLFFHYLSSGKMGTLNLGPISQYPQDRHSIWAVKLLTNQRNILVSRVLLAPGVTGDCRCLTIDLFDLPHAEEIVHGPQPVARQFICGLHIDDFFFSDLETSWFESLRDPEGLLPAPTNEKPPCISIFATTRYPRGFVQLVLQPEPIIGAFIKLPFDRGVIQRYRYNLPAVKVWRSSWKRDSFPRPLILPGAYRSIVVMRPHVHKTLRDAGATGGPGIGIIRFCTHTTRTDLQRKLATPKSRGANKNVRNGMDVDEPEDVELESPANKRPTLHVPNVPQSIVSAMRAGTMAMAWDESVGRMCVSTMEDTGIHVLDFGGGGWELAVVEPCQA